MRTALLFKIGALLCARAALAAAPPFLPSQWLTEAQLLSGTFSEQMNVDRALCREEIENGITRGEFTAEHLELVRPWLEGLDAPIPYQPGAVPGVRYGRRPSPPEPTIEPVLWLLSRRSAVERLRGKLFTAMYKTALDHAERAWFEAKKADDLKAALDDLTKIVPIAGREGLRRADRDSIDHRWRLPAGLTMQLTIIDAATVLGSKDLPARHDPERDPEAFALFRSRCQHLSTAGNRFLMLPQVRASFDEIEARFFAAYEKAKDALDESLLQGLSAAECSKRFEWLCSFEKRAPRDFSLPEVDTFDSSGARSKPAQFSTRPDPAGSEEYLPWLKLLAAEGAGRTPIDRPAGGRLGLLYSQWRERALGSAYPPEPQAPSFAIESKDVEDDRRDPETNFIAVLKKLGQSRDAIVPASAMGELVGAWEQLRSPAPNEGRGGSIISRLSSFLAGKLPSVPSEDFARQSLAQTASALSPFAGLPGGHFLFALRERAGRHALDRIAPGAAPVGDVKLGILLRERLESSIAEEQFNVALQVLALGELTQSLPPEFAQTCRQSVHELRAAKATDRDLFFAILARAESPAAAAVALRRLGKKP